MTGKEFEELCVFRMNHERRRGRGLMRRCGVQGGWRLDPSTGTRKFEPSSSPPDFEGVEPDARQFMFDAKVCSLASYSIDNAGSKRRWQIPILLERSEFNVATFLLIHLPERVLKTKTDPIRTVAFPIHVRHPFWINYLDSEIKSISRAAFDEYGIEVEWSTMPGGKKPTPDILAAVSEIRETLIQFSGLMIRKGRSRR